MTDDQVIGAPVAAPPRRRHLASFVVLGGMLTQQSLAFITGIFIARAIGASGYGVFNILRGIFTALITLAPIGLDVALLKHASRLRQEGNLNAYLTRMRLIVLVVNVVCCALMWLFLGSWMEHDVYKIPHLQQLLLITLIGTPFAADLAVMGAVYKSEERPALYALLTSYVQPVIRLTGALLLFPMHWNVGAALVTNTLSYAISAALVLSHFAIGMGPKIGKSSAAEKASNAALAKIFRESSWMALSLFTYAAMRFVDVLILGAYAPPAQVGAYGALSSIAQMVAVYPMAVSQTLGPTVATRYREGDLAGVRKALSDYMMTATVFGGFVFGGIAAFGDHLFLIFGHSFVFSPMLCLMMPLGWLISAALAPTGYALSMTGAHKSELVTLFAGSIVLVIGCFLFIPKWQAIGASGAVLIAFLVVNVSRFALVSRRLGFIPGALKDFLPPIIALAVGQVAKLLVDAEFGKTFVSLILGSVIYTAMFAAVILALFSSYRRKLLAVLKR